ncbi:hypothetical protein DMUE_5452 [Dictyocoela muelleri]|nr:hypothetical protein DMUE_5452 [Dictyocoela muelleri]
MRILDRRNSQTLLPIIEDVCRPGTIIYSDECAAYRGINNSLGLEHSTVNHTIHFVNLVTNVHTQHIESYCNKCKKKIKNINGTTKDILDLYINEWMWRERNLNNLSNATFFY